MGTINAYRDSSDAQLVHIVPSGFQSGESSNVNVRFILSGYDEKVVTFTAQDTLQSVNPVPQPGVVDVTPSSIDTTFDVPVVLTVGGSGVISATCDNASITLQINQQDRTITVSAQDAQSGTISISVGSDSGSIPVTFRELDVLSIIPVPSGQSQYITETIRHTVSGTSKEVTVRSSDETVEIVKVSGQDYVWDVTAVNPANNVKIYFEGTGIKTTYKVYNFQDLITLLPDNASVSSIIGVEQTITITNSNITNLSARSDNRNINVSVSGNVITINSSTEQTGNITVSADHSRDLVIPVIYSSRPAIVGSLDNVSGSMYIGEEYVLTVNGNVPDIECVSSDPRVKVEDISTSGVSKFRIYTEQVDGISSVASTVTVSGADMQSFTTSVVFKALTELVVTENTNNIPFDITALFTITNGVSGMSVSSVESAFTPVIVQEGGNYKLKVTSTGIATGDVVIAGRGIVSKTISVVFTDKDTITLSVDPSLTTNYVGESVVLTVSGTTRPVTVSTSDRKLTATPVNGERYKWTINATDVVTANVIVSGTGVKETTKEFAFEARKQVSLDMDSMYKKAIYVGESVDITFTGSSNITGFNVVSSNPDIIIRQKSGEVWTLTSSASGTTNLTINGDDMVEKVEVIRVLDLRTITTVSDSFEASYQEDIAVTLSGVDSDYEVQSSDPLVTFVKQGSILIIRTTQESTADITIGGRGYVEKVISVLFDDREPSNLAEMSYTVVGASGVEGAIEYVGRSYTIIVDNPPLDLTFSVNNDRLHVFRTDVNNQARIYVSTDVNDGTDPINGIVTLRASGYRRSDISLQFKEVETPVISEISNNVPYTEEVVLSVSGLTKEPSVFVGDTSVKFTIEKSGVNYLIKLTSGSAIDTTVAVMGEGVLTTRYLISFTDLKEITVSVDDSSIGGILYGGDVVTITVDPSIQNLEFSIEKSGDVMLSKDASVPNKFKLTCDGSGTALIKFSANGYLTKTIERINWIGGSAMNVIDVEGLGTRYIGETMTIKVLPETVAPAIDLGGNSDLVVSKITSNLYKVTSTNPTSGIISFTARGYTSGNMFCKFIEPVSIDLSSYTATVCKGESVSITLPKIETSYQVVCNNSDIEVIKETQDDGTAILTVTSSSITSGTISVVGRGITCTPATVTFKPAEVATIVIAPGSNVDGYSYTDETVTFSVVGSNKQFSVFANSNENDHVLEDLGSNTYRLTKPTKGTVSLRVSGPGVYSRTVDLLFLDVVVPTLGYNLSYDSFYVNETPLLLISSNVTTQFELVTDDGSGDSSIITCTKHGNNNRCFAVSTSAPCNGSITIRGRGIKETSISCIFESLKQASLTYIPANKQGYVTKGIVIESDDNITASVVSGNDVSVEEV